jgi:internalin A
MPKYIRPVDVCVLLLSLAGCTPAAYPPKDPVDKAVLRLAGRMVRDDKDPARPVVALDLDSTFVTDAGLKDLKELAGFKALQTLNLRATYVTDAVLKELADLTALRSLNLSHNRVTDLGLKDLANLERLQALYLGNTYVTDAGLKELANLKRLRFLSFNNMETVTDAKRKEMLAGLRPGETLGLYNAWVTDVGLKELAGLKDLETLDLSNTTVTDAGVATLQKALPRCHILLHEGAN